MITIQLKAKKEENVLRFHPWIFSGAIAKIYGKPEEGDIVKVTDNKGNFLAIGHYQIGSITVRILSFTEQLINRYFWKDRLTKAYDMRKSLNLNESTQTTAYRLVHGEGDNLPGLIIDIYGNTAVMQAHSVGMHYAKDVIAELLIEIIPEVTNVYYKSSNTLPYKAPVKAIDEYLIGGGIFRDVMAGDRPYIFVKHIYACASILGALVCALLWNSAGQSLSMILVFFTVLVFRILAIHFEWNLPHA